MKVLTRSRGTPAAAFAMYWSRNALVDTGKSIVQGKGHETKHLLVSWPLPPQARRSGTARRAVRLPIQETRKVRARTRRHPEVLVDRTGDAGVLRTAAA